MQELQVWSSGSGRSPGRRHGNPLQYSCLKSPMDRGAWWATVQRGLQRDGHDWSDLARTHTEGVGYGHVLYLPRSDQSLSHVRLFVTPWIAARQASLSITNSQSSLRLTSIKSVMPSSHLILCHPLLLLPPIPPSISLFQWVNSSHEVAKVLEFQL